jgi:methoxymalonate biosynthesis protein
VKTVKCLIWDLDDTLWDGVLLEDGEVHLRDEIRRVVLGLDQRGVLQAVASRNDHDHAWQWVQRLGIAEYIVLAEIGWRPKSASVRAIAERLQFALDTVAFIDDTALERAEVAHNLPDVRCYPAELAARLLDLPEFTPAQVTGDARRRRQMYRAGFAREAARTEFAGPDEEFLRSAALTMEIRRADQADLARVEELTLRTSQMNATGVHYSRAALRRLLFSADHEVLVVSMADRFGPHGAVGIILLAKHPRVWHLKLLATSCRVVAFGAGAVLLNWLTDQAAAAGVNLVADLRRTERNRMMEVAYRFAGFGDDAVDGLETLPPASDGVQRLSLRPVRSSPPTTMTVDGVSLARPQHDLAA